MDISTLVPLPVRISPELCNRDTDGGRYGTGVAVCQDMLVICSANKLQVFALPSDIARGGGGLRTPVRELAHVRTLGGVAPMEFQFCYGSGRMAFTGGSTADRPFLLVTDCGYDARGAVHVVDVVRGEHVGYVVAPGTNIQPSGVATRKSLAAVCFREPGNYKHVIRVFENSGNIDTWTAVREIAGVRLWSLLPEVHR
jgi:hypothetical protein